MRIVDFGTLLRKYEIQEENVRWVKSVYEIDAKQTGGWQFIGDWVNLRLYDFKVPCPIIVCTEKINEKTYHLISIKSDGTTDYLMNAKGHGWANIFLPVILDFYRNFGYEKIKQVEISGEALKDMEWIKNHLPEPKNDTAYAVDFALRFTREAWSKQFENKDTIQQDDTYA